jgi:hypothetical protein
MISLPFLVPSSAQMLVTDGHAAAGDEGCDGALPGEDSKV